MATRAKTGVESEAAVPKLKHVPGSGKSERFIANCETHSKLSPTMERKSRAVARAEGHKTACLAQVFIVEVIK